MNARLLILLSLLALATPGVAQTGDSARVVGPDTLPPVDSAQVVDTLSEAQKAQLRFEERYRSLKAQETPRPVPLSFFDSAIVYFATSRLNCRDQIERSYRYNAGDYARFDPAMVVFNRQPAPLRETVQPFGLSGSRMSVLSNGTAIHPFEHVVEPDGLIDFNDLPMTLDDEVYFVLGGLGNLFGDAQPIATMITRPQPRADNNTHSAFLVDKGRDGLSNARGRYSKWFGSGKRIDMSVAYRQGTGIVYAGNDKSYNYDGNFLLPLGARSSMRVAGHLYDRRGSLPIWPDSGYQYIARHRFDRSVDLAYQRSNSSATAVSEIGYRHLRQGTGLSVVYNGQFNQTGHGMFATRTWIRGTTLGQLEIDASHLEYDNGHSTYGRWSGTATARLAHLDGRSRWAIVLGQKYVEAIRLLPTATAVWLRETERLLLVASLGYNEREPSLHELHSPLRLGYIYSAGAYNYADSGNAALDPERQLVGSITAEIGPADQSFRVSVTGGKLFDGIDWDNRPANVQNNLVRLFTPYNGDVDFVTVSGLQKVHLADLIRFSAGGSYHYVSYAEVPAPAYTPEYQAFSGLEIHLPWKRKLLDLFGYGELMYVGPYDGYVKTGLGDRVVVNGKLSFTMGRFRFHYIFQNLFQTAVESREYFTDAARFQSWGFVWNFLN
ncbi:MAG: hypothetical protein AB1644_08470 [Candidatus Zixiibacteriota bacterium]